MQYWLVPAAFFSPTPHINSGTAGIIHSTTYYNQLVLQGAVFLVRFAKRDFALLLPSSPFLKPMLLDLFYLSPCSSLPPSPQNGIFLQYLTTPLSDRLYFFCSKKKNVSGNGRRIGFKKVNKLPTTCQTSTWKILNLLTIQNRHV